MLRKMTIGLVLLLVLSVVSFASETYPQLVISGYKSYFHSSINVIPDKAYFGAIMDSDVIPMVSSGGPWQEQLSLRIDGRVTEDLNMRYGLFQFPGASDLFDLNIDYKNYKFLLGSQRETLGDQEFVSPSWLNGMGVGGKWGKLKAYIFNGSYSLPSNPASLESFSSAKLFRDPRYKGKIGGSFNTDNQYLEYYGFDLGRVDFQAEELKVYADKKLLIKDFDYFLDRQTGLLLVSGSFRGAKEIRAGELIFQQEKDDRRRAFYSPDQRILEGSEIVKVDNITMIRGLDYRINYTTGLIIMSEPVRDDAEVRIDYNYFGGFNFSANEVIIGQSGHVFNLANKNIIEGSEIVTLNGTILAKNGYQIDYLTGRIYLLNAGLGYKDLVPADSLQVTYQYWLAGLKQDIAGANVEYALADNSRLGATVLSVTPSSQNDQALYNKVTPLSSQITNFYAETVLNKDTVIRGELGLSSVNPDNRTTVSTEADNAMNLTAKTKLWDIDWTANYWKTGLNFATANMVMGHQKWGEERFILALAPMPRRGFNSRFGSELVFDKSASQETKSSQLFIHLGWQPFESWGIELEERRTNTVNVATDLWLNNHDLLLIYSKLKIPSLPLLNSGGVSDSNIYSKLTRINIDTNIWPNSRTFQYTGSEAGLWLDLKGGITPLSYCYISYKTESGDPAVDLTAVSTASADRVIPYFKIGYETSIFGSTFQLYYDYSFITQTGTLAYKKSIKGVGMLWETPIDNPVLSKFQAGGDLKTTDYRDIKDSNNDYCSSEFTFHGALVF